MGGWIAETLAFRHPERVRAAVFIGSCNVGTSWEKAITTVERDLARLDPELPPWFNAVETMRYLPNHELQQDDVVDLLARPDRRPRAVAQPGPARTVRGGPGLVARRRADRAVAVVVDAVPGPLLRARRRLPAGAGARGGRT